MPKPSSTSQAFPPSKLAIAPRRTSIVVAAPTPRSTRAATVIAERIAGRIGCDVVIRCSTPDAPTPREPYATDAMLCVGLPTEARRTRSSGRSAAARAIGSFDGPVLFVTDGFDTTWEPTAGPMLAMPSQWSTGAALLGHAAAWSRDIGSELWLAAVIDRSSAWDVHGEPDKRGELLAAALLGRLARDLKRAGADAEWDVLYGQGPLAAARSVMGNAPPAVIGLELARPVASNRALWATVLSVARHVRVPVLTLPPCEPVPAEVSAPAARPAPAAARRAPPTRRPPDDVRRSALAALSGLGVHELSHAPREPVRAPMARTHVIGALAALPVLFALTIAAVSQVHVPYYAIHPGDATVLESVVQVDGAPTYAAQGALRFVTVRTASASVADAVRGWLDGDVDVVRSGTPHAEAVRQWYANRDLMDQSKLDAAAVALRALGHDVVERGSGARIVSLEYDAPAATLLRPGDVIVGVASRRAAFSEDVALVTRSASEGDIVAIDYLQQGTGDVRSGLVQVERLADGTIGLGAMVQTLGLTVDLPINVDIPTPNVVGPSAGLAFALGLLEVLTPGDLTGDHDVAATGAMDADGVVTAVGGLRQKVIAATRSGATVLLVPDAQRETAERQARGGLRVVGVRDLADALHALHELGGDPIGELRPGAARAHSRHVVAT